MPEGRTGLRVYVIPDIINGVKHDSNALHRDAMELWLAFFVDDPRRLADDRAYPLEQVVSNAPNSTYSAVAVDVRGGEEAGLPAEVQQTLESRPPEQEPLAALCDRQDQQ